MGILDVPVLAPSKAQNWARSFRGIQPRFGEMDVPPTITGGTGTSSVNSSFVNGDTYINAQDSRLVMVGSVFTNVTQTGARPSRVPNHITDSGAKSGKSAPIRVRFLSDATSIDFCFLDRSLSQFNLIVDGKYMKRDKVYTFTNTGNYRYIRCDFPTDVVTYSKAQTSYSISNAGTGHAVGDILTFDGGTGSAGGTPLKMKVTQVSSGTITSMDIQDKGAYTSIPTGTFTQVSSTGTGTGATFTATFFHQDHSSRRLRSIELVYSDPAVFMGIVVASTTSVFPYPVPRQMPRLVALGDSITIGTYLQYGASHIAATVAQKLGLWDDLIINGIGGTGWNTAANPWNSVDRIQDIISCAPDLLLITGSQNDTAGSALTAAVTAALNAYLAAFPKLYIVGIGNILGNSTAVAASIEAGYLAASDQRRVKFINNQTPNPWMLSTDIPAWTIVSDQNHLNQAGMDRWAELTSLYASDAFLSIIK